MKNYKPMGTKKVNFYFFLSENCPISFIRKYVDRRLQIEIDFTMNKAISAIKKRFKKNFIMR